MSNNQLFDIFEATLSADKGIRGEAEDALVSMSNQDEMTIVNLLEFAASPSPDVGEVMAPFSELTHGLAVRLAASVRLRNVIHKTNWNRSQFFSDRCRNELKGMIVQTLSMSHLHDKILKQLVSTFQDIIDYDWPGQWPGLVESLIEALTSGKDRALAAQNEDERLMGLRVMRSALSVMRYCCKKHEDQSLWGPNDTDAFCNDAIPLLLNVSEFLLSCTNDVFDGALSGLKNELEGFVNGPRRAEAVFEVHPVSTVLDEASRHVLKCIWSLINKRFPAVLCEEATLVQFLDNLVAIWRSSKQAYEQIFTPKVMTVGPMLGLTAADLSQEMQNSAAFKKMKWVGNITHQLLCDFILTQHIEPRATDAGLYFLQNYAVGFANLAMHSIEWHHNPVTASGSHHPSQQVPEWNISLLSSKFYIMCVTYLDVASGSESIYQEVIHPGSTSLLTSLLFERLCFTEDDDELWKWNPEEYIRKQVDPKGDLNNPKVQSMAFIHHLCVPSMPFHDKGLLYNFISHVLGMLDQKRQRWEADNGFGNFSEGDYLEADACLFAFLQLRQHLMKAQIDDARIEDVLTNVVNPLAGCPRGYVRARAIFVLARFSHIEWTSEQAFTQIVVRALDATTDEELPVRIQACTCLSKFIRHEAARPIVEPQIAELIEQYFKVMKQMDHDGVVRTLRKTIKFYGSTLSRWAVDLCEMILNHFAAVKEDISAKQEEFAKGGMDTDDVLAALADGTDHGKANKEDAEKLDSAIIDAVQAGEELIETMTTLVRAIPKTSESTPAFESIQALLAPMFHALLATKDNYGFMDGLLSLLSDLVSHSPGVHPEIWRLVPALHYLATESATDYITQIMIPLDNMISVDPPGIFSGYDENSGKYYIQLLADICSSILQNSSSRNSEKSAGPALIDSVFLNCDIRGLDDSQQSEVYNMLIPTCIGGLQLPKASPTLKVLLANSILAGTFANADMCTGFLANSGGLAFFFESYVDLIQNTDFLHLRETDRKIFVLAFAELLKVALGPNSTDEVSNLVVNLFTSGILPAFAADDANEITEKITRLKKLIRKADKKGERHKVIKTIGASNFKYCADFQDEEEDDDDDLDTDSDDDIAIFDRLGESDEDEEFEEEEDGAGGAGNDGGDITNNAKYQELMSELARHNAADAEASDDDENLLIDEEVSTPIDKLNCWSILGSLLMENLNSPLLQNIVNSDEGGAILAALNEDGGAASELFDERVGLLDSCRPPKN